MANNIIQTMRFAGKSVQALRRELKAAKTTVKKKRISVIAKILYLYFFLNSILFLLLFILIRKMITITKLTATTVRILTTTNCLSIIWLTATVPTVRMPTVRMMMMMMMMMMIVFLTTTTTNRLRNMTTITILTAMRVRMITPPTTNQMIVLNNPNS